MHILLNIKVKISESSNKVLSNSMCYYKMCWCTSIFISFYNFEIRMVACHNITKQCPIKTVKYVSSHLINHVKSNWSHNTCHKST